MHELHHLLLIFFYTLLQSVSIIHKANVAEQSEPVESVWFVQTSAHLLSNIILPCKCTSMDSTSSCLGVCRMCHYLFGSFYGNISVYFHPLPLMCGVLRQ